MRPHEFVLVGVAQARDANRGLTRIDGVKNGIITSASREEPRRQLLRGGASA